VQAPEQVDDVVGTARQLAADMSGFLGHLEGLAQAHDRLRAEFDRVCREREEAARELAELRATHAALAAELDALIRRLRG
jgi:chromosome segregation ATPase